MNDTTKPLPNAADDGLASKPAPETKPAGEPNEAGRTLLVGFLGGLASAVGYTVYTRLSEEQKERLHRQVKGVVESRINEIRSSLNL
jgi:hypothetical protein